MVDILSMNREQLTSLEPQEVTEFFTLPQFLHIADTLGARWVYNREAAKQGKKGLHAGLKSRRHSGEVLNLAKMFEFPNIRRIFAVQMCQQILPVIGGKRPAYIVGVPNGGTLLGQEIANIFGSGFAEMKKQDGKIRLVSRIGARSVLFVDDVCSRGTAMAEAIRTVSISEPDAKILTHTSYSVNRGGRNLIVVEDVEIFRVHAVVQHRIEDFDKNRCKFCIDGSEPIDFKSTPENWEILLNSQK